MEFLHIPKTGGTSVSKFLVSGSDGNNWSHYRASLIPEEKRNTVWSVIRNPYDRAISIALHASRKPGQEINKIQTAKMVKDYWLSDPYTSIHKAAQLALESPLTDYVADKGVVIIPHLVEFKDLPRFFESEFGIPLPHENPSARKRDYKEYYDEELFDYISKRYADDIKLFNYEY